MMVRRMLLMSVMVMVAGFTAAADKVSLNAEKSKIGFVGSKPDGQHEGGFEKFTSEAMVDLENPSNGSLEIIIAVTSLWSDDDKLTNHLKNPDFFDVRKHPKIIFKAAKIELGEGGGKVSITGMLSMLGKDVEATIPVVATVTDTTITMAGDFKIDRTKWGMDYGQGKINNDVIIKTSLVFDR